MIESQQLAVPPERISPAAVRLVNLTSQVGSVTALQEINLEVASGTLLALVGPYGGGKTTLLRVLATLVEPTSGEGWLGERSLTNRRTANLVALRADLGYLPDVAGIYDRMTVQQYLEFFARAYFVSAGRRQPLIRDLLELVNLTPQRDEVIASLAGGLVQRLALARTLIHDPQLLLLDEPANGLDRPARLELRELLVELGRMGKTILLTAPALNELTEICTHLAILHTGRLLTSGRVTDLLEAANQTTKILRLKLRPVALSGPEIQNRLTAGPSVQQVRQLLGTGEWEVRMAGQEAARQAFLRYLIRQNLPVYATTEHSVTLEDVLLRAVQSKTA